MLDPNHWTRTTTQTSAVRDSDIRNRSKSHDASSKDIWSSMLDGVASVKKLPKKNILVLGGTSDTEREFLESLSSHPSKPHRQTDRVSRNPPIANQFALGYTYQDVLDAEHEDILARLSLYFLAEPTAPFVGFLKPLLTANTLPECLIVILLDWTQPWLWLRELREWIYFLRQLLASLDDETLEVMRDVMIEWKERRRGGSVAVGSGGGAQEIKDNISIPLGTGEWDEALGVPICVVCQKADKMEYLEKELGWKEEDFDFVLQSLRTVLLKHGGSLIYTSPSAPNSLQALIHSSLGIHSLPNQPPLRHNIVERDKVLVPSNWDSWGKIRVLREGFNVEEMSISWSNDIRSSDVKQRNESRESGDTHDAEEKNGEEAQDDGVRSAVTFFEEVIDNTDRDHLPLKTITLDQRNDPMVEIESLNTQEFLSGQLKAIESIKAEEENSQVEKDGRRDKLGRRSSTEGSRSRDSNRVAEENGRVNDHIGPVRVNMGGIQVDADDMLRKLKDRENIRNPETDTQPLASPDGKSQNDALASFFAGLMKRGGSNSPKAQSS